MSHSRVAASVLVAIFVAATLVAGGWGLVSDGERVEAFFTGRGLLGPVVFIVIMWTVQPLGVPGVFFMVPAAVVWPAPLAIVLSWTGNMGASFLAFTFARWLARDWAQKRVPAALLRWDDRLEAGGVREVAVLRLFTGQLTPADWLLGVSSVRVQPFLVGTGIGIVPGILLAVLAGGSLATWAGGNPARWLWVGLVALAVILISRVLGRDRGGAARL